MRSSPLASKHHKRVLVTGGSGFLGKRLRHFRPEWFYISSADCDLMDMNSVKTLFYDFNPDVVLHLAARVGGIKDNKLNQAEFYYENTMINTNVIHAAYCCNVERVLSSLSTCAFPNEVSNYPFSEESLLTGPPAETNFSYGYTKRSLHVQTLSYRQQYGVNYSTFCPSNIYGPGDYFGSDKSHFIASLVYKIANCEDGDTVEFWGSGSPLRQQLYVDDLCTLIPQLIESHNTSSPLIVAPDENLSIKQMIDILLRQIDKKVFIKFNGNLEGQYRKDGSNKRIKKLVKKIKFTSFEDGILQTYKWYLENK
jgi:GDP-L-fucose synthase